MKGQRVLLWGLGFTLLLSGCTPALLEREYVTEQLHVESGYLNDSSILRADNYDALVECLLQLVEQGAEHGIIRLVDYAGDGKEDIARACLEVKQSSPLGAYAVDYMTHEISHIVSYDQVHVYITYRRSYEEIKHIVSITGSNAVRQVLADTMTQFAPSAVLSVSDLGENAFAPMLQEVYDTLPGSALGLPELTFALYPSEPTEEKGRILEVQLTYRETQEQLLRKQTLAEDAAEQVVRQGGGASGKQLVIRLYQALLSRTEYVPDGGDTVYDGLVHGKANSEGMAMAMALVCQKAGLSCEIVRGVRNGTPWVWNRVVLEEETVELDVSANPVSREETPEWVFPNTPDSLYEYGETVS